MSDAISKILELEQSRIAAISAGDGDGLRSVLTEDYTHCHATGLIQSREELIRHVLAHPREIEPRRPSVRLYGDTAVLTGALVNIMGSGDGRKASAPIQVLQVAVKVEGAWKFAAFQATALPVV